MYDFLLMEEWWMETIIASVITAAATITGYYLVYSAKIEKLIFRVEQLAKAMEKDVEGLRIENKETHAGLSHGHGKLSEEHGRIRDDLHKIYYANHEKLLTRIEKLNRTVARVQEENRQLRNQINILSKSFDTPDLCNDAGGEDEWEEEL